MVNLSFNNVFTGITVQASNITPAPVYAKKGALARFFNYLSNKTSIYCLSMELRTARVNSWVVALPPMSRVLWVPSAITS